MHLRSHFKMSNIVRATTQGEAVTFLTFQQNGQQPVLTAKFEVALPPTKNAASKQLVLRVFKSMNETLYNQVKALEEYITTIPILEPYWSQLPFFVRQIIFNNFKNLPSLVRPNYYENKEDKENDAILYLKGNLDFIKVKENGRSIPVDQLGPGTYEVTINANKIYFGEHKHENQVMNLLLRIKEINYTPLLQIPPQKQSSLINFIPTGPAPAPAPEPAASKPTANPTPRKRITRKLKLDTTAAAAAPPSNAPAPPAPKIARTDSLETLFDETDS